VRSQQTQTPHAQLGLQYRMCDDIVEVANLLTYNGRLRCGNALVASARLVLPHWHLRPLLRRGSRRSLGDDGEQCEDDDNDVEDDDDESIEALPLPSPPPPSRRASQRTQQRRTSSTPTTTPPGITRDWLARLLRPDAAVVRHTRARARVCVCAHVQCDCERQVFADCDLVPAPDSRADEASGGCRRARADVLMVIR
jgi:hypothetical protein